VPLVGGLKLTFCACEAAFFARYKLASSCSLPMFFLYRMRLLPNQLVTYIHIIADQSLKCNEATDTPAIAGLGLYVTIMHRTSTVSSPSKTAHRCSVTLMAKWCQLTNILETKLIHRSILFQTRLLHNIIPSC